MARLAYCLALYLAAPLVWLRLFWRARRQPEYRQHLGERWGFYSHRPAKPCLWVHAVSVGETRAAQPLVEALLAAWPDHIVLLTGMTPTGRDAGRQVYGDRVFQAYLPYDYPGAVRRFFQHFQPRFGILMETEIWPNLLAAAEGGRVPVLLANARLSERSARGYQRFAALARPAFRRLTGVAAQTGADAERLRRCGAGQVDVCGNLKFDVSPAADKLELGRRWRTAIGSRPVWLAASTREGEENLVLQAFAGSGRPDDLLVLVPRHPQRFDEVAAQVTAAGLGLQRRSTDLPTAGTQVWLGDSMGEMAAYYTLADLAFIGGSLLPLGGQNLIEAAACGCPVLVGPHTFNFSQATEDAIAAGAARRVADAAGLAAAVRELLADGDGRENGRAAMAEAAESFAAAHRGATARTLALIERLTAPAGR